MFSILQCLKTKNGSKSFNEPHRHTHAVHMQTHIHKGEDKHEQTPQRTQKSGLR